MYSVVHQVIFDNCWQSDWFIIEFLLLSVFIRKSYGYVYGAGERKVLVELDTIWKVKVKGMKKVRHLFQTNVMKEGPLAETTHVSDWRTSYRKTSNISRTLVGNKIVNNSDVVGASPVGAAPTTFSLSTQHLASMNWAKTTAWGYKKHLRFGIW